MFFIVVAAEPLIGKGRKGVDDVSKRLLNRAVSYLQREIGNFGAIVSVAERGNGGYILGIDRAHIADGLRALAMPDQMDLASTGGCQNLFHFAGKLLSAHLGAMKRGLLGDEYLGTTAAQLFRNAIKVAIGGTQTAGQGEGYWVAV